MVGYRFGIAAAVVQATTAVQIQSLAQELLHAGGAAKKKKKCVYMFVYVCVYPCEIYLLNFTI